jgi:hypothetical protein
VVSSGVGRVVRGRDAVDARIAPAEICAGALGDGRPYRDKFCFIGRQKQ